jgi:hypothetical protein
MDFSGWKRIRSTSNSENAALTDWSMTRPPSVLSTWFELSADYKVQRCPGVPVSCGRRRDWTVAARISTNMWLCFDLCIRNKSFAKTQSQNSPREEPRRMGWRTLHRLKPSPMPSDRKEERSFCTLSVLRSINHGSKTPEPALIYFILHFRGLPFALCTKTRVAAGRQDLEFAERTPLPSSATTTLTTPHREISPHLSFHTIHFRVGRYPFTTDGQHGADSGNGKLRESPCKHLTRILRDSHCGGAPTWGRGARKDMLLRVRML